jgi:copper(I)-binding protein
VKRSALVVVPIYVIVGTIAFLFVGNQSKVRTDQTHLMAVTKGQLTVSHVTITVNVKGARSAVSMQLANGLSKSIALLSIKSPVARGAMMHFDSNMCQGNSTMIKLAEVDISSGHVQVFGYKHEGAMLAGLEESLRIGQRIPLTLTWQTSNQAISQTNIVATVVKPPSHLHLGPSAMPGMPGM